MARLPRVELAGVPQHIIQRGNNRQVCFASEQDFAAYANWLKVYSQKFNVQVHAWVLMTNHAHILCTPQKPKAISQMMQGLGRQYVRYFNYSYKRTGTLWEGRFKSCLVQDNEYLLHLYRYIELNPVRAGMVKEPANYPWSSYQINAIGKQSELCTPHSVYLGLGINELTRQSNYRDLFKYHVEGELLNDIRKCVNQGFALGNEKYKSQIEQLTGRKQSEGKRGRPVGWKKQI